MSTDKYFEREYNFLQTAGEEFSKKHPTLGSRLHMSERERKDPFVERLYEGFAFLAGRIHERLDDEFPEIAGGILEILFPNLLKTFPSCSILQVNIKSGALTEPVLIKKSSEIQTQSGRYKVKYKVQSGSGSGARLTEKEEPTEFIFRTTQDVSVRPIKLTDVITEETAYAKTALTLKLQLDRNVDYNSLKMDSFRLYLYGSASVKYNLHLFLTNYLSSVFVREVVNDKSPFRKIEDFKVSVPELSTDIEYRGDDYSLLPYSKQSFSGFRLLQEYFAFPEKFFFIDIHGLNKFQANGESSQIEIKLEFDRKMPREKLPEKHNIMLNCTPIVNLFSRSTEEVPVNQRMPEYYIVPDLYRRKSREVYSVDKVSGISENRVEQYKYIPITAHDILDTSNPEYNFKRFFSVFRRTLQSDMAETFIRLFGPSMEEELFPKETLSIEATLSNGFLPSAYLEVGSIKEPLDFPPGVEASNIAVPTEVLDCPEKQNYLWSLIAHLSVSFSTLAYANTFKSILNLYNWAKAHNHPNKKRIDSIKKIHKPKLITKVMNQSLIRGIEFHIEVDSKEFENGEGEINLFGMVLNKFLSHYVTLNSYVFLKITESGTSKSYTWNPSIGEILPI
ncbi:MAG TPA: type VI secretion system baseplate subunit TssF [Ignavibacteriaceae bacterium]|nr:type VI secretion system baseplate subunit TssF [Ignavibacteriaceae bacterium]